MAELKLKGLGELSRRKSCFLVLWWFFCGVCVFLVLVVGCWFWFFCLVFCCWFGVFWFGRLVLFGFCLVVPGFYPNKFLKF